MLASTSEQIKTAESKTQQMEAELALLEKKHDKLIDKDYLEEIEAVCESQASQIKKLTKDNAKLQQDTKNIERKLDKQVKTEQRNAPRLDTELKNLRAKLAFTNKKYETEYNKLIDLAAKRKDLKEREAKLMKKETKIIITAKKEHGIDFENAESMT